MGIIFALYKGKMRTSESLKNNLAQSKGSREVNRLSYDIQWENAARSLAHKHIRGLEVTCPLCGNRGIALSKWVKGISVKPLYVCHSNGSGELKSCRIEEENSAHLRARLKFIRSDVLKAIRLGKPYILFSGGKDSLCLLHYISSLAKSIKRQVTALHADTTAGFQEVEKYVKRVCKKLEVPLIVVKPPHDYYDLAKRWGIPGVKSRWCCKTLKVAPIRRYLSQINEDVVIFDGIRAAESNIRATYVPIWYHPTFRCISVSPLFYWSDIRVQEYIRVQSLPTSPVANLNTSAECWCGAYKSRKDFEALLSVHPEIFNKLVEVEEAQNGKFTFLYEEGERITLNSLKIDSHTGKEIKK
jgi:3'-phosphoadenosine 5'-phosphosulfate sulfotransferase (PAPS reductase)/FAD synthetase